MIFQGTAGVMFLGYTLSVLAILGSAKVIVALLVLAVPIIDTFWVIVGRVSSGRSPFSPDRGHIHHRLLDVGLSHRTTVLLIYVCARRLASCRCSSPALPGCWRSLAPSSCSVRSRSRSATDPRRRRHERGAAPLETWPWAEAAREIDDVPHLSDEEVEQRIGVSEGVSRDAS